MHVLHHQLCLSQQPCLVGPWNWLSLSLSCAQTRTSFHFWPHFCPSTLGRHHLNKKRTNGAKGQSLQESLCLLHTRNVQPLFGDLDSGRARELELDEGTRKALRLWATFLGKKLVFPRWAALKQPQCHGRFLRKRANFQVADLLAMSSIGRKVVGVKVIITDALGHAVVSI